MMQNAYILHGRLNKNVDISISLCMTHFSDNRHLWYFLSQKIGNPNN